MLNSYSFPLVQKLMKNFLLITNVNFARCVYNGLTAIFGITRYSKTDVLKSVFTQVAYHANLVLRGKTTFESNRHIDSFNLGWKQNLIEVFGSRWRLAAIWPFVTSRNITYKMILLKVHRTLLASALFCFFEIKTNNLFIRRLG